MRRLAWIAILGFASISTFQGTAAAAERLNDAGRFAISGERLFGVGWTKATTDLAGTSTSVSVTSVSLLGKETDLTLFTFPRIALDYFVTDGLSLGGAVGYSSTSENTNANSSAITLSTPAAHAWLLAPRVGYAYMFNDYVGLWPRAGITYVNESIDLGNTTVDSHVIALSIEAPLAITPVPHTLITIAPTFDWGFSGSASGATGNAGASQSADVTAIGLGLHAGLGIWF